MPILTLAAAEYDEYADAVISDSSQRHVNAVEFAYRPLRREGSDWHGPARLSTEENRPEFVMTMTQC